MLCEYIMCRIKGFDQWNIRPKELPLLQFFLRLDEFSSMDYHYFSLDEGVEI